MIVVYVFNTLSARLLKVLRATFFFWLFLFSFYVEGFPEIFIVADVLDYTQNM